jgi:uncharacterized protein DUF3892
MRTYSILFLLLYPAILAAQGTEDSVRLVDPATVPRLPPIIRSDLIARDCLIPRGRTDSTISAIHGEFQRSGQVDWAILCVNADRAQILVFRDNESSARDSFPSRSDHLLAVAKPSYIIQHLQWYSEDTTLTSKGDSLRVAIAHDGIEDSDTRCCSTIYYWQGGRWQEYPGAD